MEKETPNERQQPILGTYIKKITNDEMAGTYLFEVAWEVCNQVGGIYTVIQSKVLSVLEKWRKENYILLGPYIEKKAASNFEPIYDPSDPMSQAVEEMNSLGYKVYYGQWLIAGRPRVILFDPFSCFGQLAEIKYFLWENHKISSPAQDELNDQVVAFGHQVHQFFKLFSARYAKGKRMIAHFHEWMAGTPIPNMRRDRLPVKIVFTTHATLLGRYLAMNDPNFYDNLPNYNWHYEAGHFYVMHIAEIERAAAHGAHVFSTVSEITVPECIVFLGRKPDIILPNGLNIDRFEALHEFQNLHRSYKEKINEFVMGHFFQSYSFDLDKTLYFFTSGRFEYNNKGYDLTLEALNRLNRKMKQAKVDMTVVMFIITRNPYTSINPDVLQLKALLEEIQRNCDQLQEKLAQKLFYAITSNEKGFAIPDLNQLIDDYMVLRLRTNFQSWRTKRLPAVVTHNLINEHADPIMNYLNYNGMLNLPHDKVKVVYHPDFVATSNPLFRMEYYQFIRGCHMGIFPSYYEPWGYTPLECIASGIPSVTSDLAGFGSFVESTIPESDKSGIYVLKRKHKTFHEAAENLADILFDFVKLNRRDRITQRNKVEASSTMFDWGKLGKFYDKAYGLAIRNKEV
jgi:glycogen(starch) synthase